MTDRSSTPWIFFYTQALLTGNNLSVSTWQDSLKRNQIGPGCFYWSGLDCLLVECLPWSSLIMTPSSPSFSSDHERGRSSGSHYGQDMNLLVQAHHCHSSPLILGLVRAEQVCTKLRQLQVAPVKLPHPQWPQEHPNTARRVSGRTDSKHPVRKDMALAKSLGHSRPLCLDPPGLVSFWLPASS